MSDTPVRPPASDAPAPPPGDAMHAHLERWMLGALRDWDDHWKPRTDHRFGKDLYAFLGERLLTDFHLRDAGVVRAGEVAAPQECPWCHGANMVRLRDGLGGDRTIPCPACSGAAPQEATAPDYSCDHGPGERCNTYCFLAREDRAAAMAQDGVPQEATAAPEPQECACSYSQIDADHTCSALCGCTCTGWDSSGRGEADREVRTYPEAARTIALWLAEFCDHSLPYPAMIAVASRAAGAEIDRHRATVAALTAERDALRAQREQHQG
jgi:hypothetical protein